MEFFSSTSGAKFVTFYIIIVTTVLIPCFEAFSKEKIIVFPHDFVRFKCLTLSKAPVSTDSEKRTSSFNCTWNFLIERSDQRSQPLIANVSESSYCVDTTPEHIRKTNETVHEYEGYIRIPEEAAEVYCDGYNMSQQLDNQRVQLVNPLSERITSNDRRMPKIILQRFSDDFGERLGAHEVTNMNISIDGKRVDRLKLLCIHSSPIRWTNITTSHARILGYLKSRDGNWLHSGTSETSGEVTRNWKYYLDFLWKMEKKSFQDTQFSNDTGHYSASLVIQNITDMTGRLYECQSTETTTTTISSHVAIRIEDPRTIGPDEIELIQQILGILDNMDKGQGKDNPYYTLGSISSIILILFMYYCKKKLDQPKPAEPVQTQVPSKPMGQSEGTEEVELRRKLRPNPQSSEQLQPASHDHDDPVSVVTDQR